MTDPLLTTKLYIPPTRPELVPRPRLVEKLNDGLYRKLTLISAPAGFGKTTLVSEWVEQLRLDDSKENQNKYNIAWFSLDENDKDPARFLTYFISALNRTEGVEATLGDGALTMLQSPQPPPTETILTSLINEIADIPDRIIIVLDDYHVLESSQVDDALTLLLEHLPPQLHLVIATREDPYLPLSRLRSKDQSTELRAADLRFTSSEAAEFLNQVMGLHLSKEDIATLEIRTEGWIAGLQFAAISLQGQADTSSLIQSFTGSHRLVLDYLIEEVLDQKPEKIKTFLLQTAILDRLIGSLCDALTGQDDGQQILEYLDQANLFLVPLDNERCWYRYHHLFADLLLQRLHQTQPEQLSILHLKASGWYQQNGFIYSSVDHALLGKNFEQSAYLIEDQFGGNYEAIDQTIMRRWLAELPEEFVSSRPDLCIHRAWNLFTSGQLEAAARSLKIAEKMLDPNTDQKIFSSQDQEQLPANYNLRLMGRATAIRSILASFSGDIKTTIDYAHEALDVLPEQELEWRSAALIALGDAYASMGQMTEAHKARSDALETAKTSGNNNILMIVNLSLAETLRHQGRLQQVINICERQLKKADDNGISESAVVGWLLGIWGEVLVELNDLETALDKAKKGVKLAAQGRDVIYIGFSNLSLVRVLFSKGDLTGAEEIIKSMENTAYDFDLPHWVLFQLAAWQAQIWLAQDKLGLASQWVEERELDIDGELAYQHEVEYVVLVRILIIQGKPDEATRLLNRLLKAAEAGGRMSRKIGLLILQALAYQTGGETSQAIETMGQALALAEPHGFIRTFVDEGQPMKALLNNVKPEDPRMKDYIRKLLFAFSDKAPSSSPTTPQSLIEPLSERELEVLQLIAKGLTNPEIASRLYLSLNTVKVHSRNIYGKLGVNNRTQAVVRAKDMGILPAT